MLDIKYIRANASAVQDSIAARGLKIEVDNLLSLDDRRRELMSKVEALRAQLKNSSAPTAEQLSDLKRIKTEHATSAAELEQLQAEYMDMLMQVPNILAEATPRGGEEANTEIRAWGEQAKLDFKPKDHLELNDIHHYINFEAGAKVAGNKFYFLQDKAVRLWQAVVALASEQASAAGFVPMMVPHMVNNRVADGTGFLPRGEEEQIYKTANNELNLIATSEMPLAGLHMDDVIDLSKPKLYAGLSPCYRLEAGAYGKFSKGLYRVHQFEKLELFVYTTPELSEQWLEKILAFEEQLCQLLELPYRVVRIAAGDLSAPAYKKYDVEYASPVEDGYRELTSCSNCTDYQARRLNIRYRNPKGGLDFAHTLNGTAVTSSRTLIALLENHQQADGTIRIPQALVKYYGEVKL